MPLKPTPLSSTGPSASVERHRTALDQALRQALGTSQPALRRQALDQAARHLIHPRLILESPLLTDSHPWRHEALAVSDAFEAVTNGMEDPSVFEALEGLDPGSPFQPWKHLVLALHFYYAGLDEAVAAHLVRIPGHSPVAALARVVSSLIQGRAPLPGALAALANEVAKPDPEVQQWIQDVAEGLETDDEPLFYGALADWLETVAPVRPDRAQAAVVWAWNQLEWRDFDEATLLDLAESLWGRPESYRLAALGTVSWDAEGAALLWLRFLLSGVRDGTLDQPSAHEVRSLLDRFQRAAHAGDPPGEEWTKTWSALTLAWNTEAQLRGWGDLRLDVEAAPATPSPRPSVDGQLDLFA